MPRRSRNIIVGTTTIAFCASLMLHAAIALTAIDQYASERIYLAGFDRTRAVDSTTDQIVVPLPPPPPTTAVPEPASPQRIESEPKLEREPQPELKPEQQLGKTDGIGDAIDDSPGDLPLLARQAPQNQPLLSRDPVGPGALHADPSQSLLPSGEGGAPTVIAAPNQKQSEAREPREAQAAVEASIESPELRAIPFGVGSIDERPNDVPADRPATIAREAQPEVVAVAPSVAQDASPAPQAIEQIGRPGTPGSPSAGPADPAAQSDTESDPFTVLGGAQFRPGKTSAQLGRAHRLTYPRIGLSGLVDGVQIGRARVVLQITIDSTGNVRSATTFKSSGSDSIDQACRTTAYDWWFEPQKAKDGKLRREETFLFIITFS